MRMSAAKRGRAQRVSWEESQGVGFRKFVGAPMGEIVGLKCEESQRLDLAKFRFIWTSEGQFKIGTVELLHCKFVKAHSIVTIELGMMIIPGAATMAIWDDAIGSLLTSQGGRRQYGVESRGDLERKLQKWLGET